MTDYPDPGYKPFVLRQASISAREVRRLFVLVKASIGEASLCTFESNHLCSGGEASYCTLKASICAREACIQISTLRCQTPLLTKFDFLFITSSAVLKHLDMFASF